MTLTRIATGPTYSGRQQAALGNHIGGLGLRRIKYIAIPVELAAKLTAKPLDIEICNAFSTAGLMEQGHLTSHLEASITNLQKKNWRTTQLDHSEAHQNHIQLNK